MFHYTRNFYYIEFKQLDNHSYPKEGFNEIKNLEFSRFGKTNPPPKMAKIWGKK